jgi:hypothetical protein
MSRDRAELSRELRHSRGHREAVWFRLTRDFLARSSAMFVPIPRPNERSDLSSG